MMRVCFTIGSWVFISILNLAYILNNKETTIRSKLYRSMLILNFIILVTEIISTFTIVREYSDIVLLIWMKIHWLFTIAWFYFIALYDLILINDVEADSFKTFFKENAKVRNITYLTIVALIVFFILPFDDLKNFNYFPGLCAYWVLGYGGVVAMGSIIRSLTSGKITSPNIRFAFISFLITLTIILSLQFKFPGIAFGALGISIHMLLLFFSVENPDIKLATELNTLQSDIDKSNKTKSDFLASMSNNIASPVNDIITYSKDILTSEEFDVEKTRDSIDKIVKSGNGLLNTINNVMDITILESTNDDTLNENTYSTINLLKDLIGATSSGIESKHIQFILDVDSNLPSKLVGDYNKLYQCLLNILTNSIQFTNIGKIKMTVYSTINNNDCSLVCKISDTGEGMKKEVVDSLNEEFSKKNKKEKSKDENKIDIDSKGHGVGIALIKKYSDLMDAIVEVDSEYGAGSSFKLTVNQKIADATPVGDTEYLTQENKVNEFLDCSKYKMLIVDDDDLSLKIITRIMELYKFQIETLKSGRDCIYNIKLGKQYDIIFIDHMMHGIDGIDTMQKLHKLEDYKIPPIVVLTANALSGMREKYIEAGFDDYLSKPINKEELDTIIKKYFNK